jgi:hypothetical protein
MISRYVLLSLFQFMLVLGIIICIPLFTPNSLNMAEQFAKNKMSFCDLDENARMFACPAMRRALPVPGGAAVAYACDSNGEIGFISFFGEVSTETKTQLLWKLTEAGLKVGPHCKKDKEEVIWIKKGPWKTALTQ